MKLKPIKFRNNFSYNIKDPKSYATSSKKENFKKEVANKINEYLKNKYIHIDGPPPLEEYGTNYVSKSILREALDMTFEETFKLCNKE